MKNNLKLGNLIKDYFDLGIIKDVKVVNNICNISLIDRDYSTYLTNLFKEKGFDAYYSKVYLKLSINL